ncbi:MAG: hypothetical protein DMF88_18880 [Acidobacteria bacterium]|nr:MAG: hypothetical protein DMF88_18880 [Acidobacteriota bacterium]
MDALGGAYKMQFSATGDIDGNQEDRMKRFTSIAAAVFTAAFLTAATASAQDSNVDQRTFLTFSGPVQMPGTTLPAGKYVFKLAPTSLHNVMQVFDGEEKHIIGQWFFVPANRTSEEQSRADGKPVVMFREMPEGMTPAIHYFFYPTDLTGKEFIYPKDQAVKIAAATHEAVLATDTEIGKGEAHVFRVEPNGTEASTATTPEATGTTGSTASLNSQADTSNSPASGPPSYSTAQNNNENTNVEQAPQTTGTSGAYDQNPAPRQQASSQLPKTASPLPVIGLFGLLSLLGGFGFRLARNEN